MPSGKNGIILFLILISLSYVSAQCEGKECKKCILSGCYYIQTDGLPKCVAKSELRNHQVLGITKTHKECKDIAPTNPPIVLSTTPMPGIWLTRAPSFPIPTSTRPQPKPMPSSKPPPPLKPSSTPKSTMSSSSSQPMLPSITLPPPSSSSSSSPPTRSSIAQAPVSFSSSIPDLEEKPPAPTKPQPASPTKSHPLDFIPSHLRNRSRVETITTAAPLSLGTTASSPQMTYGILPLSSNKLKEGDSPSKQDPTIRNATFMKPIAKINSTSAPPTTSIQKANLKIPKLPIELSWGKKLELAKNFTCPGAKEKLMEKLKRAYCRTAYLERKTAMEKVRFNDMRFKYDECFLLLLRYKNCV